MGDISISFPPRMIAWFLLGEATPVITLVLMSLAAAFFFSRGTGHTRRVHWLKWTLVIVGGLWLGGISFWAAGLVDQIKTDIYQARHHYRLDKSTVLAGIEIPKGSWISVDEDGTLYAIDAAQDAVVSIDGALWRGDIRLIPLHNRTTSDRRQVIQNKVGNNDLIEPVIDILIWSGCIGVPTDSGTVYISDCGFKRPYIRALMRNNDAQEIVFHPTLASIFATPSAAPARSAFRRERQTDSRQGSFSL
jgi:hypothetical protein